jgi:hypothetical protein
MARKASEQEADRFTVDPFSDPKPGAPTKAPGIFFPRP